MAKRGKIIEGEVTRHVERAIPEGADPALFDDDLTLVEDAMDPALGGLLSELGADSDAKVTVHRLTQTGPTRKEIYCYECPPADFRIADIQESYGEGEYAVRVYVRNSETGKMPCRANKRVTLAAPPKKLAGVPALAPAQNFEAALISALERQAASTREMLAPLLAVRAPAVDPMVQFETFSRIMKNMQPAAPAGGMGDLGNLRNVIELVKSLQPETPVDPDNPNALLLKGLEFLTNTVAAKRGEQPALPASAEASPMDRAFVPAVPLASVPVPPAGGAAPQPTEEEEMKLFLKMLLNAAQANADIEEWADKIAQFASDEALDELEKPEWFARLVALAPECAAQQPWLTRVRDRAIALISEEEKTPPDAGAAEPGKA